MKQGFELFGRKGVQRTQKENRKKARPIAFCLLPVAVFLFAGCAQLPTNFPAPWDGGVSPGHSSTRKSKTARKREARLPANEQAEVCLATAEEMDKAGKYKEAVHFYDQARRKDRRHQHVCWRMAVLFDKLGQFTKAEIEYQRALKLTPRDADLLADVGYSLYCQGRWQSAEKFLRRGIKANPDHARCWVNLGMALGQQKQYKESFAAFRKAVPPAQAYSNLAFIYMTHNNLGAARAAYHQALREHPNFRPAVQALAKLQRREDPRWSKTIVYQRGPRTDTRASQPLGRRQPQYDRPNPIRDMQRPVHAPDVFENQQQATPSSTSNALWPLPTMNRTRYKAES